MKGLILFLGILLTLGASAFSPGHHSFRSDLNIEACIIPLPGDSNKQENGVDGIVNAMVRDEKNNLVYLAGDFRASDKNKQCGNFLRMQVKDKKNRILATSECLRGEIKSLAFYRNRLYAAGNFGLNQSCIAMLEGDSWNSSGNLRGIIFKLIVCNDVLYAGGDFTFADPAVEGNNFAKWNGTEWVPVAGTLDGAVYTINNFRNKLIIRGNFTHLNTLEVNHEFGFDGDKVEAFADKAQSDYHSTEETTAGNEETNAFFVKKEASESPIIISSKQLFNKLVVCDKKGKLIYQDVFAQKQEFILGNDLGLKEGIYMISLYNNSELLGTRTFVMK